MLKPFNEVLPAYLRSHLDDYVLVFVCVFGD